MMKLLTTSVAALGLAGFMFGGTVLPAAAAPTHTVVTVTTVAHSSRAWHRHHRPRWVKVRTCKNMWRHHHRVRVCTTQWRRR